MLKRKMSYIVQFWERQQMRSRQAYRNNLKLNKDERYSKGCRIRMIGSTPLTRPITLPNLRARQVRRHESHLPRTHLWRGGARCVRYSCYCRPPGEGPLLYCVFSGEGLWRPTFYSLCLLFVLDIYFSGICMLKLKRKG